MDRGKQPARAGAAKPAKKKRGRTARVVVRWSREREERFLESLGATPNVAEAIRASGLSDRSVRRRREACTDFRDKWLAALRAGYARLEADMLVRAIDGVEKPVWYGGEQVGTIREHNDRVAITLLRMHRETVNGTEPLVAEEPIEAARARLAAHLSEMNRRMGGAG